jgi:hypothetical protein
MYLCIPARGRITEHRDAKSALRRAERLDADAERAYGRGAGLDCGIVQVARGIVSAGGDASTGTACGNSAITVGCSRWVRMAQEYLATKTA